LTDQPELKHAIAPSVARLSWGASVNLQLALKYCIEVANDKFLEVFFQNKLILILDGRINEA
jgi:hypothetical protein